MSQLLKPADLMTDHVSLWTRAHTAAVALVGRWLYTSTEVPLNAAL